MVPIRQHPRGAPLLSVQVAGHDFENHVSATSQPPAAQPVRRKLEEAAMPRQPARTLARFRLPLTIHPRESSDATSVTAIIVCAELNFLLHCNPLCGTMSRPAMEKRSALVQKLWRRRLRCGRLRKSPLVSQSTPEKLRPRSTESCQCAPGRGHHRRPADATPRDTARTSTCPTADTP
jgi:hypothetical protein